MSRAPYHLTIPAQCDTAVVFSSPHSGRDYPWDFIRDSQLDELTIRSSEDAFVDRLLAAAPDCGAPVLAARLPRAFVDLNRAPDELDPALIDGVRQPGHNPRIASGLGVIPRVVANGRAIRSGKMPLTEAQARLAQFYYPYHGRLAELLATTHSRFGQAVLFDCHSMPHDALGSSANVFSVKPDVVLGNRFGASCSPEVIEAVEAVFQAAGLKTACNLPFAGAYITQKYGRPAQGRHVVQIEIDRALYMVEDLVEPRADFDRFKAQFAGVVAGLADIGRQGLRLAAQ